jgi:hypothetical protein
MAATTAAKVEVERKPLFCSDITVLTWTEFVMFKLTGPAIHFPNREGLEER